MLNDAKLSIFSDEQFNSLVMLYLQNQNLAGLTPEQILDEYDKAYSKLRYHYENTRENRRCVESDWN